MSVQLTHQEMSSSAIRFSLQKNDRDIARAFLYLIKNDLHAQPYGLLEDVFVQEQYRSQGYGRKMAHAVIEEAKKQGCYKLIGTSRYERKKVHQFYLDLGFREYGKEFRMNL